MIEPSGNVTQCKVREWNVTVGNITGRNRIEVTERHLFQHNVEYRMEHNRIERNYNGME